MELILASASPRRREMLTLMGYDFTVKPSRAEENIGHCAPGEYVSRLARIKAAAVAEENPGCCVLGSDTIVYLTAKFWANRVMKKMLSTYCPRSAAARTPCSRALP